MVKQKQEILVHYEFTNQGENVTDILMEVFRTYIYRKIREKQLF